VDDVEAWADAMGSLLADGPERERRSVLGRTRAEGFSWDRCAAATVRVYQEAGSAR
jgi:glycosyltransferase involved in cell wall biosynthesis